MPGILKLSLDSEAFKSGLVSEAERFGMDKSAVPLLALAPLALPWVIKTIGVGAVGGSVWAARKRAANKARYEAARRHHGRGMDPSSLEATALADRYANQGMLARAWTGFTQPAIHDVLKARSDFLGKSQNILTKNVTSAGTVSQRKAMIQREIASLEAQKARLSSAPQPGAARSPRKSNIVSVPPRGTSQNVNR
jgi:uncharacterized small protein (DUF1192 family)